MQTILQRKTSPALSELKKNRGERAAIEVLVALMDNCQAYFNLQQPMSAQQLITTAELIMEEYYYLRIDEFQLCFKSAMKGEYGPLYNRIDGQVFFEWIKKFMITRQSITDKMVKNDQVMNNIYEIFNHPAMKAALEKTIDEMPKVEIKKDTIERKLTSFEQMILNEYDALPAWSDDARFKVYNMRPYLFSEYRKERYDEEIKKQNEY